MASGTCVMDLIEKNLRPRDIVTRKAMENAATVVAATGGSTNAGLHLPAIANEAGIDFDLAAVAEVFKRTPYIADLKPGGRYVAKDLFEVGGVPIVLKALLEGGYLHGDCMTVTGRSSPRILPMSGSPPSRTWWCRRLHHSRPLAAWWGSTAISRRKGLS